MFITTVVTITWRNILISLVEFVMGGIFRGLDNYKRKLALIRPAAPCISFLTFKSTLIPFQDHWTLDLPSHVSSTKWLIRWQGSSMRMKVHGSIHMNCLTYLFRLLFFHVYHVIYFNTIFLGMKKFS